MGEEAQESQRKPEGGFRFLTVGQLCLAWTMYREGRIRFLDLRTYFACHELAARRCVLKPGQSPDYQFAEVGRLIGGGGEEPARAAVARLQAVGLLTFSTSKLAFAASPEQLGENSLDGFWAMLEKVTNNRRRVPVPRRILRFIAGGARQVVVATILGHLLRCLYYRDEACSPVGAVKASWVASVFGVDARNVKEARGHLEDLGWLTPRSSPQWHQNRYGKTVEVNLAWSPSKAVENPAPAALKSPPPPPPISAGSPPPDSSDRELSSRSENQKPAVPAERPGFSTKTEEPKKPSLQNVVPEDLKDTGRLLVLFEEATRKGLLRESERERLNFVAAAEHARVIGSRNPCGLFAWLVRRRKWEFITEGDDESAHRRLKVHLYGDPRERAEAPAPKPIVPRLSDDAQFVRTVRQVLRNQGLVMDAFEVASRARPGWSRERWDAAAKELDDLTLTGVTSARSVGAVLAALPVAVGGERVSRTWES